MSNTLMTNMPSYYNKSKVISNLTESEDMELIQFNHNLEKIFNQFFIDTADLTLDRWEEELGLKVNNSKDVEHRRSVIKAKLRGTGTITFNLIKEVAESYANGKVAVTEHNENFLVTLKFVDSYGIPPNLEDLKRAIEEIKPAHIAVNYEFTYMTWEGYEGYNRTWDQWDGVNITWDELEIYGGEI